MENRENTERSVDELINSRKIAVRTVLELDKIYKRSSLYCTGTSRN